MTYQLRWILPAAASDRTFFVNTSITMASSPLSVANVFDLKGRIAVVTGGGTGIGWMIAEGFATNGAKGAPVLRQPF